MAGQVVAVTAGAGVFPFLVAEKAKQSGRTVVAVGFEGHTDSALAEQVDAFVMIKVGQLGKLIRFFKEQQAGDVVFAGAINKPKALEIKPDLRAVKALYKAVGRGDDALLRAVADEIETEGMRVVSPLVLLPELGAPEGVLTRRKPKRGEWKDLRYGLPIAKDVGAMDIGQCLVVKRRMVVAVEAIEGTDACIRRAGELAGPGCTVIKVVKPNQDPRLDLPAVGADTIRTMADAGAVCLGVEAGKTLLFQREETIAAAERAGISVVGLGEDSFNS